LKEPFGLLRINTDTVIVHGKLPVMTILLDVDMNSRWGLAAELEGVANKVLQHLA